MVRNCPSLKDDIQVAVRGAVVTEEVVVADEAVEAVEAAEAEVAAVVDHAEDDLDDVHKMNK